MRPEPPRHRFSVVGIVAISLFAALFARLWFLQVMTAPEYQVAAENNRIRVVQQEAPRGRILDRTGKHVLVDNRRSIVVTVDWQRYDKLDEAAQNALLAKLARSLTRDQLRRAAGQVASIDSAASSRLQGRHRRPLARPPATPTTSLADHRARQPGRAHAGG
ncbi:MAG: hypothetical protein WKF43_15065 [Acidimicrobiales bacterium]